MGADTTPGAVVEAIVETGAATGRVGTGAGTTAGGGVRPETIATADVGSRGRCASTEAILTRKIQDVNIAESVNVKIEIMNMIMNLSEAGAEAGAGVGLF